MHTWNDSVRKLCSFLDVEIGKIVCFTLDKKQIFTYLVLRNMPWCVTSRVRKIVQGEKWGTDSKLGFAKPTQEWGARWIGALPPSSSKITPNNQFLYMEHL